jgi:hypothetical protein
VHDAPVSERHEVLDRQLHPTGVVRSHRGDLEPVHLPVDQDHPDALLVQRGEQRMVEQCGRHDQALDLSRAQRADLRVLATQVVVGAHDQGAVAGGVQHVLDAAHDRREERVGQVGDHQPHGS